MPSSFLACSSWHFPCGLQARPPSLALVLVQSVVHPRGLHPVMAVRAHHLYTEEGLSYAEVRDEVHNMQGKRPRVAEPRKLEKQCWRPSLAQRSPVQIVGNTLLGPESCTESPGPDSWKNTVGARVLHRVARSRKLEKQCWHPSLAQSRPAQGVGKTVLAPNPLHRVARPRKLENLCWRQRLSQSGPG